MKTIIKICMVAAMVWGGIAYANAQSAASSSKQVVQITEAPQGAAQQQEQPAMIDDRDEEPQRADRGFPMPDEVEKLLRDGKAKEAANVYEKFYAQQKTKASPYDLLYNACGFYGWAKEIDPSYKEKFEELLKEMFEQFPDEPEVLLMQITPETSDEEIVELMTKAIAKNPELSILYEYRGRALMNLERTKEACQDFEKLSRKEMMPEYWPCKDLE